MFSRLDDELGFASIITKIQQQGSKYKYVLVMLLERLIIGGSTTRGCSTLARIELRQCVRRNSLEHFLGEDSEQLPSNVK